MKNTVLTNPIARMESYLSSGYDFRFNEILNNTEFKQSLQDVFVTLNDFHLNTLYRQIRLQGTRVTKFDLINTLNSDFVSRYNPFVDYFAGLSNTWNSESPDYILELAQTISVQGDAGIFTKYLRKWLVAVVACALKSEAVNDMVFVLVGKQGLGKTKWLEKLLPQPLRKYYYSGIVNPADKDSRINLAECFLINLDELECLRQSEIGSLKEMISMRSNRIRRPYSAFHENIARRASFMGSVNSSEFLKDNTGNRRFLCFEAEKIQYNHGVDMNKVYAQALALLKEGFQYWLNNDEIQEINDRNGEFREVPYEIELISAYFNHQPNGDKLVLMKIGEIIEFLKQRGENLSKISPKSFGSALKTSDFIRTKKDGYWFYKLYPHKP